MSVTSIISNGHYGWWKHLKPSKISNLALLEALSFSRTRKNFYFVVLVIENHEFKKKNSDMACNVCAFSKWKLPKALEPSKSWI